MYISLSSLCFGVLFVLGTIALIILIMVLIKLFVFLKRVDGIIERNEKNVDEMLTSLPKATKNFLELSDDLKAVGEVITETTATAIETKEHIGDYMDIFKDVLKIIKTIFAK
jgi:F0F1-type ATP synthase membrane subunit b/b'